MGSSKVIQTRVTLSPMHAAALQMLADHDGGRANAPASPVIAGLIRAELARRWPEAWQAGLEVLRSLEEEGEPRELATIILDGMTDHLVRPRVHAGSDDAPWSAQIMGETYPGRGPRPPAGHLVAIDGDGFAVIARQLGKFGSDDDPATSFDCDPAQG